MLSVPARISGPLFDRFDMVIEVPEVATLDMLSSSTGEPSEAVMARVAKARDTQKERFARQTMKQRVNAELSGEILHQMVPLDSKAKTLLEDATGKLRLSMRGYTRVLRVARTIADLVQSESVSQLHVGEALSYRQMQFGRIFEDA